MNLYHWLLLGTVPAGGAGGEKEVWILVQGTAHGGKLDLIVLDIFQHFFLVRDGDDFVFLI